MWTANTSALTSTIDFLTSGCQMGDPHRASHGSTKLDTWVLLKIKLYYYLTMTAQAG